jgi:hypothetical protein
MLACKYPLDLYGTWVALLAAFFTLVSYMTYYSALMMKAECSPEKSADFHQVTWLYSLDRFFSRVEDKGLTMKVELG